MLIFAFNPDMNCETMKRIFDIIFSSIGLIILLPLFIIAAIVIKIDSPGPVFFRQKRIGMNFRPFLVYKFRTMVHDASKKVLQITAGGDKRITRVGRILRNTKIDELPQLINVLKGDMSFVGPRPEMEKYVEIYKYDYKVVLSVRPGITDISSIYFRNEESVLKNKDDPEKYYIEVLLPEKLKLAKEYIKKASFLYDLKLIIITFCKVLCPAYEFNKQF